MQIKTKRKLGALAIAILFLLVGVVTMLYDNDNVQVSANTGKDTIASYADAGTVLVSKYADIEVSNCNGQLAWQQIENTYNMENEGWSKDFLVDENLNSGWSTNPYDKVTATNAPVTIIMTLRHYSLVRSVTLFEKTAKYFPVNTTISFSTDKTNWGNEVTLNGVNNGGGPYKIKPKGGDVFAKYIKIHMSLRQNHSSELDGNLFQFAEVAVHGSYIRTTKPSLKLAMGEMETLSIANYGTVPSGDITWSSLNPDVASVDADGTVRTEGLGETTIVGTNSNGFKSYTNVYVVEKENDYEDKLLISVFWCPTDKYLTNYQYQLMADAGIDLVGYGVEELRTTEHMERMAELSYKYGMDMSVEDGTFGASLLEKDYETIKKQAEKWKNVAGVGSYIMIDEPMNPNVYIDAYKALKDGNPSGYMHLNFLPEVAYYSGADTSSDVYRGQLDDFVKLCKEMGYEQDYLMFDMYPFRYSGSSIFFDREGFYKNLDSVHDVGLVNGVKTSYYLQTVNLVNQFPNLIGQNDASFIFEVGLGLAYGYKQFSYFTWFCPGDRGLEKFTDGILSQDGKINQEYYDKARQANGYIKAFEPHLARADALEIYFNGNTYGQTAVPSSFFAQPQDNNDYIVSFLKNKVTGRNYLFVQNNSYTSRTNVSLKLDSRISSLSRVSHDDGSLSNVSLSNGVLNTTLDAGFFALYALPTDVDFETSIPAPAEKANLALDALISCNSSVGGGGLYMSSLNDGYRGEHNRVIGWRSNGVAVDTITIDLNRITEVNRIDLFPIEGVEGYGYLPKKFKVYVSNDGVNYDNMILQEDAYQPPTNNEVPQILFDTVTTRYIKIVIEEKYSDTLSFSEIEIYNDDGTIPVPYVGVERGTASISYTSGSNIALNKTVSVSSSVPDNYIPWGWAPEFLVDGDNTKGWSTNIGIHPVTGMGAIEYATVSLGDVFNVTQVVVVPPGSDGGWPTHFQIRLSKDGVNWTVAADVTGESPNRITNYVLNISEPNESKFIQFYGIDLSLVATGTDGYLLQLKELMAYGTPVKNLDEATACCNKYLSVGGKTTDAVYTNVISVMSNANKTQSELDVALKQMLNAVGLNFNTGLKFTIEFKNHDGTLLQSGQGNYGSIPIYKGETPTKAQTTQYVYTFDGWNKEISTITGDTVYTAKFIESLRQYTVTFLDEDGSEISVSTVSAGGQAVAPTVPQKAGYRLKGWYLNSEEFDFSTQIYSDLTISCEWEEIEFTIEFKNYDGTLLQSGQGNYGSIPIYKGETPTKAQTTQYVYTFDGWNKEISTITGDTVYTAKFIESLRQYTVTFLDEDGSEISVSTVSAGGQAVAPTVPQKAGYRLKGWYLNSEEFDFSTQIYSDLTISCEWEEIENAGGNAGGSTGKIGGCGSSITADTAATLLIVLTLGGAILLTKKKKHN